jgi:peptide/nickel transport system permease protein
VSRAGAKFFRNRGAVIGLALVTLLTLLAIVGPALLSQDPNHSDFAAGVADGLPVGPGSAHLLGTDALFRDELARLLHGARLSLGIAATATVLSSVIGAAVGILAGYLAGGRLGWVDSLLMRLVDVLLSFPYLLLVMAIGAALEETSAFTVLAVLGLTSWLGTARLIRAKTLQVRELAFVEAARALGQRPWRILLLHLLPGVLGPLIVVSTMSMAGMILAESVLSYLQVGVQPPTATWGRMLYEGQHAVTLFPRLVLAPGLAILASVLGFNLVGEGLRDAFDPREAS